MAGGSPVSTRNSKCLRLFCVPLRFASTPLVSVRKTAWKNALREWEWFMSGSPNVTDLHPDVRHWWAPWGRGPGGYVPFNYSMQFRQFVGSTGPLDQIAHLIDGVKNHPYSRRNAVTTWNASEMASVQCPITNCHNSYTQAFVEPGDDSLHLVTYQRSADVVCGLPHNLIQMWAFLVWLAHRTEKTVGSLSWVGGDVHLYEAHYRLADKIVRALPFARPAPELVYAPTSDEFRADDFTLNSEYAPCVLERAEMVV